MNVLLVDDDRFVLTALIRGIDWESLGFTQTYTAANLLEAKKMIEKVHIDLLLSDIDMPNGSGLDLLSWIRETHGDMITIFLTNYADFEYAKRALELRSFHYFLKPIDFGKLTEIIRQATKELQTTNLQIDKMMERFLISLLLEDRLKTPEEINQFFEQTKLPDPSGSLFILTILDYYPYHLEANHMSVSLAHPLSYIRSTYQSVLSGTSILDSAFLEYNKNAARYIAVFRVSDARLSYDFRMGCEQLIETVFSQTKCNLNICVGTPASVYELKSQFEELKVMLANRLDGQRKLWFLHEYVPGPNTFTPFDAGPLERYLDTGQYQPFLEYCHQYLTELSAQRCLHSISIKSFQADVTQVIYAFLKNKNILAHKLLQSSDLQTLLTNAPDSIYDMELYLQCLLATVKGCVDLSGSNKSIAEAIRKYVDQHYAEDIHRSDLSDILYLDSNYAAKLFKKETGMSFGTYLIEKRINAAKDLLANTDLPVNEVSSNVGYANYSYFIRLFRKITHMTPIEYRRMERGEHQ